ncbi:DNA-3-methyladenine glycosylase I [Pseudolysinimonas sp.]|uniref:DNA-3-methyladenine glycosylase I n=1 Tax=Pseudolysinimonas sp. TaxID=2680009 RepID=UPI003F7E7549
MSVVVGADGRARCGWAGSAPEYLAYHDEEWGTELHGDREFFERMSLEGFQAGLSWITILRRRDTFRAAFAGFDIEAVAAFDDGDVARLMADPGIIRNAAKVDATISNARVARELVRERPGALDELLWSFAPPRRAAAPRAGDVPATTPESVAASRELKRRGFRFVGPTTVYALMQATGMVDDHEAGCWRSVEPTAPIPTAG